MPAPLAEVVSDFGEVQGQDKLKLLLEFADELPALPADLEEAAMEPVPECQSPLFLHVDASDTDHVRLFFSAPAEAPTTRGFASILAAGLDGQSAADILAVPDDFYSELGLAALISPLRLRGMSAMLARIKRRLRQSHRRSGATPGVAQFAAVAPVGVDPNYDKGTRRSADCHRPGPTDGGDPLRWLPGKRHCSAARLRDPGVDDHHPFRTAHAPRADT